jgi:hypothetical protein
MRVCGGLWWCWMSRVLCKDQFCKLLDSLKRVCRMRPSRSETNAVRNAARQQKSKCSTFFKKQTTDRCGCLIWRSCST